jgi:steroid delta-isomerase-like uncharacterized protein
MRLNMPTESLPPTINTIVPACHSQDLDLAVSLCTPDYEGIDVAQVASQVGPEGLRKALEDYMQAFPDLEFANEETIVEANRVVNVWRASGTHRGALMNIPPTGRRVSVQGVSVLTLSNGRVQRGLYLWDVAGLLRSIGLLPEL